MIKAEFFFEDGHITGFSVKGHAGFAKAGKDIVCASVSMLVINTINAIEKFTEDKIAYQADEKGAIGLKIENPGSEADLLLNTLLMGLESVRSEYGKKYIEIKKSQNHKEV